jgi:hypothetical protein
MPQTPVEHFVTLFDSKFLPMGMALHDSLRAQGFPFHLWVVCMDDLVEQQLGRIALPHLTPIPLGSLETPELLAVKPSRSRCEYCWTLTPFTFQAVFDQDDTITRVTYLDADLFFFDTPLILLRELDASERHVLITEHAYAPEYQFYFEQSGRFCVQFLTFRRSAAAQKVMRWWQERCLEWCFDLYEDGKFGDQKYLDDWQERFAAEVHVLQQTDKTLAPWNVAYTEKRANGTLAPVFYHFQAFRITGRNQVRLYAGYHIGPAGMRLYDAYLKAIGRSLAVMKRFRIATPVLKEQMSLRDRVLRTRRKNPEFSRLTGR